MNAKAPGESPKFETMEELQTWMAENPLKPDESEVESILTRFVDYGPPEPAKMTAKGQPFKSGKSGPKSIRTQYDDARDKRKELYRRTALAPNARRLVPIEKICEVFDAEVAKGTDAKELIRATEMALIQLDLKLPDLTNITRALVRAGRWPLKTE